MICVDDILLLAATMLDEMVNKEVIIKLKILIRERFYGEHWDVQQ
jgi:hypothetical protein